jgi:hypothetical protein
VIQLAPTTPSRKAAAMNNSTPRMARSGGRTGSPDVGWHCPLRPVRPRPPITAPA